MNPPNPRAIQVSHQKFFNFMGKVFFSSFVAVRWSCSSLFLRFFFSNTAGSVTVVNYCVTCTVWPVWMQFLFFFRFSESFSDYLTIIKGIIHKESPKNQNFWPFPNFLTKLFIFLAEIFYSTPPQSLDVFYEYTQSKIFQILPRRKAPVSQNPKKSFKQWNPKNQLPSKLSPKL